MTDEAGEELKDEEKQCIADWRVRAGPRNKPAARDTKSHTCHSAIGAHTA